MSRLHLGIFSPFPWSFGLNLFISSVFVFMPNDVAMGII